jgi:TRAP-type C4-dicarboxylate transport system permease large subunit
VGVNVFVTSSMVKDVPMASTAASAFLARMLVLLAILMVVPDLALYLPRTMR